MGREVKRASVAARLRDAWQNRVRPEIRAAVWGFVAVFAFSALASAWLRSTVGPAGVEQPIAFNHRLHVEDVGIECSDCHEHYEEASYSGMPTAETCAICHEEAQSESSEELALVSLLKRGAPLEWNSLFRQPAHVFYSHSRHVAVAGLECSECHGDFAASERPPGRVALLTMDECVDCHEGQGARVDCSDCHR